jgi:hypothetical protein
MNKSTICKIGNRLSKTMPRKEAFIQAWEIVRSDAVSFPVRSVTVGSRQEALRRLNAYNPADVRAFLMPEPENPVDGNAIAVMVGINGGKGFYKLGYVPASNIGIAAVLRGRASIRVIGGDIHGARLILGI